VGKGAEEDRQVRKVGKRWVGGFCTYIGEAGQWAERTRIADVAGWGCDAGSILAVELGGERVRAVGGLVLVCRYRVSSGSRVPRGTTERGP
jgi:hypothetical protein